jgi:type IV pilus assembly protein PilB
MAGFTNQTSEKAIQAIINAGKIDNLILQSGSLKNLDWNEKLKYLIKEKLIVEDQLVGLFAKAASLSRAFPEENDLDPTAIAALPYRFIIEHSIFPYKFEDNFLQILIIDPRSAQLRSELMNSSQFNLEFKLTSLTHLENLLSSHLVQKALSKISNQSTDNQMPVINKYASYQTEEKNEAFVGVTQTSNVIEIDSERIDNLDEIEGEAKTEDLLAENTAEAIEKKPDQKEISKIIEKKSASRPTATQKTLKEKWNINDPDLVIDFCNQILQQAIQEGVSDIHIESFRDFASVRMRKDGSMQSVDFYGPYLFKNYAAVTTRFKILADCDIAEKRLPQDGAITIKDLDRNEIDFRFSVMPTKNGERIVMRILAGDPALSLDKIGFDPEDYKKVIDAITAPQGMVLVTGPTGSGKTTTLYGALQYINRPDINILTAEDPVEYYLEGAGQVQANEKIGLSFSAILRAFLRQDPEVILVGEIRDQETIDIAIKAALTGHLLLSTLHTNDAVSTITRILNMGVPNFMISSALSLVIAQRLARKNCPNCAEEDKRVTKEILEKVGFKGEELNSVKPKKGTGCIQCGGKGLKGRQGIYEVLRVTKDLEEAILRNEQAPGLLKAARSDGFRTMQEIGRDFIAKGIISIEEYQSTLNSDVH